MAKYCPYTHGRVVYLVCQECEDRICENKKYEPTEKKSNCLCDTCFNKCEEYQSVMFEKMRDVIRCKVKQNTIILKDNVGGFGLTLDKGCAFYNKDMSQEKICLNCEYFLGGGDWGLSCEKDYYRLPDSTSEACEDFNWIKKDEEE